MKAKKQNRELTPPEKGEQSKQEQAANDLKAEIKEAIKDIKRLQKRYHDRGEQKSLIQLLVKIRGECSRFAEWLAIARIERNQGTPPFGKDRDFLEEQKRFLRENPSPKEKLLLQALNL